MRKIILLLLFLLFLSSCSFGEDSNARLQYGSSGLPSNCRALIKANIDGYNNYTYTADEVLNSINRNCGEFGSTWKESVGITQRNTNPFEYTLLRKEEKSCENEVNEAIQETEERMSKMYKSIEEADKQVQENITKQKSANDSFNKNIECSNLKNNIQLNYGEQVLDIFYSTKANTCISGIINGEELKINYFRINDFITNQSKGFYDCTKDNNCFSEYKEQLQSLKN